MNNRSGFDSDDAKKLIGALRDERHRRCKKPSRTLADRTPLVDEEGLYAPTRTRGHAVDFTSEDNGLLCYLEKAATPSALAGPLARRQLQPGPSRVIPIGTP